MLFYSVTPCPAQNCSQQKIYLNVFSPLLLLQEIICQKNTVSTQSNFSLAFAFHTLLTHCSHITRIMWCKEYAIVQRAGKRSIYRLMFLLSVLQRLSSRAAHFSLRAAINVRFHDSVLSSTFRDVLLRWQLFRELQRPTARFRIKRHERSEHLTCKSCSIQIRCRLKAKEILLCAGSYTSVVPNEVSKLI